MKNYSGLFAVITLALCCNSTAIHKNKSKKTMRRSAERVLNDKRCSSPSNEQTKLIDTFLKHDNVEDEVLYPDDLSLVIGALSIDNTSILRAYEERLYKANELFYNVPGYINLLKRIASSDNEAHRRGALYELQLALDIEAQDDGEEVLEFGKIIFNDHNNQARTEIDLVTTKRAIECKNRSLQGKDLGKLKTQLITQKKCIEVLKHKDEKSIEYEVHFKLPVTAKFAQWLIHQQITFVAPN